MEWECREAKAGCHAWECLSFRWNWSQTQGGHSRSRSVAAHNPFVKRCGPPASAARDRTTPFPRAALPLLLGLVFGCAADPGASYLFGIGDPVRGAALHAPRTFGDTSRWAGRPAEAATAAEQLEFLASELATNPRYAPEINPAVTQQLDAARGEMRRFLGIESTASPTLVATALRTAANALRAGSRAQAEQRCRARPSPPARWRPWRGSVRCRACHAPRKPLAAWRRSSTVSTGGGSRDGRPLRNGAAPSLATGRVRRRSIAAPARRISAGRNPR